MGGAVRHEPDPPIACSLDVASLTARRAGLLSELTRAATHRSVLEDGLRLTFAASSATLDLIARAIDAERQCCRFLRFQLTVEPDLGAFVLTLTGPAGAREFIAGLLTEC
jgi:hypothetical protein